MYTRLDSFSIFSFEPHALCTKSGYDFSDADNDIYDVFYQQKKTEIQDWLMTQYTTVSAPLE